MAAARNLHYREKQAKELQLFIDESNSSMVILAGDINALPILSPHTGDDDEFSEECECSYQKVNTYWWGLWMPAGGCKITRSGPPGTLCYCSYSLAWTCSGQNLVQMENTVGSNSAPLENVVLGKIQVKTFKGLCIRKLGCIFHLRLSVHSAQPSAGPSQ